MKLFASALLAAGVASGASAVTVDFTDTAIWTSGASTDVVQGATVSLASTGGSIVVDFGDAPGPVGPLSGLSDGLGVAGDEITFGTPRPQSITVSFSQAVRVVGLYFLDLFVANDQSSAEEAIASFSGGEVVSTPGTALRSTQIGFGSAFFAPITTTSITFTAGSSNDGAGRPDFALAGIEIQPIPLPTSAALFLSALAGVALLSRKRRAEV